MMQNTLENHQQKSSNIDAKIMKKPLKNRFKKKVEKQRSGLVNPGSPAAPVRDIRATEKTHKGGQPEGEKFREEHAERPTSTL